MLDILYLSHCVPNPPDKGERIRAFHEVRSLAEQYRVHLVCFAKSDREMEGVASLSSTCATVFAERLEIYVALMRSAVQVAKGKSLNTAFYDTRKARAYIKELLVTTRLAATVAYSCAVAPLAPDGVPLILDLVDVDSEKWRQYSRSRFPGFLYSFEAGRLRSAESTFSRLACTTLLSTEPEKKLFSTIEPRANLKCVGNGVDSNYFCPEEVKLIPKDSHRRFLLFTGAMDYYPNRYAARVFAQRIFPPLRKNNPDLEFLIVGRNPGPDVLRLGRQPGVTVTGEVPDIRPYLAAAWACVAPLEIARGIQNKVIEALAMGCTVFGSSAICHTFGSVLPFGLVECESDSDFVTAIGSGIRSNPALVRRSCRERFCWGRNMDLLSQAVKESVSTDERGIGNR